MASTTLLNSVRQFLASHYMFVDEDWLSGCVEYLSSDEDNNYSETEIKNLAREQWLLNDLKSICPGSLPANLKNQQKTVLNGRFVLQINAAIDIGTPAYQQYLKLQKVNMENVDATTKFEDKITSHRMIKLYLTDGVQEISGIEYKPMRNLSCDVTPGCKVLLKGPIECRRGMLLLTEGAIELLGGEVEDIIGPNSLAGQLSTKLGITITLNQESVLNTTVNQPRNTNIPTPHIEMPSPAPTSRPMLDHTRPIIHQPTFVDDDIDIDQLDALEAQLLDSPVSRLQQAENIGKRPYPTSETNPEKRLKTDAVSNIDRMAEYPDENDIIFDEDEEALRELEAQFDAQDKQPNLPSNMVQNTLPPEPFVYIKCIKDMSPAEKNGKVFNIKGQVMSLLSKLSVDKHEWSLKCTIVDGTGTLDVDFTSDVLSKLVGFTPQEMNAIKKEMAKKPELREKAVSALQKAKDALQVLYCIIEITILDSPKITNLTPFDATHVEQLKKRLENGGL